MAPVIRISDELYGRLEALARGFDTPAAVIERLLNGEDPDPPTAPIAQLTHRSNASAPNKTPGRRAITPEMTELVIQLGDRIYAGNMRAQDAKKSLVEIGMNPGSAVMYLIAYRSLLVGEVFKRGMKILDSRLMFAHIKKKYGMKTFALAIKSYALHLRCLEADGYSVGNKHRFLAEMKAGLE